MQSRKQGIIMKNLNSHNEPSRKSRKKPVYVSKKVFRRAVGFMLVLVTLLAAFQTSVLATTGDTPTNIVEVGAQDEAQPNTAEQIPEVESAPTAEPTPAAEPVTTEESTPAAEPTPSPSTEPEKARVSIQAPQAAQLFVTLNIGDSQYGEPIPVFDGRINVPEEPEKTSWPTGASAFLGWYTDAELTAVFDPETTITENINLYAKFEQEGYYVYFLDANNAVVKTLSAALGGVVEEPNADDFIVAPGGQKFLYWADNETGTQFDFTAPLIKDVTLRPVFSSTYYVYFYSEGTQIDPVMVSDGETVAKPDVDPTRDGYDFKYWSVEPNGVEYDFTAPVNGTLRLHAVWEAKTVNYTAVIWMEKPNISGDPSWPGDYMSFKVVKNGDRTKPDYAGNSIAKCEVAAGTEITEIDPSVLPYMLDTAFFHYAKTMPTTIQGNGQSVVNVLYNRNVYTMNFIVSHYSNSNVSTLPDGTKVTTTYAPESKVKWEWTGDAQAGWAEKTFNREPMQQVVYSFDAKYEQDITKLWPSQNITAKLTAYDSAGNIAVSQPDAWQPQGATMGSQGTMITKRLTLTPELIPHGYGDAAPQNMMWSLTYVDQLQTVEVNYWHDVLDGQTGVPAKGNVASGSYVKDEQLSQTLKTTLGSNTYGKNLQGMKLAGTSQQTQPDGTKVFDFYYKRNLVNLVYNTLGGSSVPAVNNVKHGQDIERYQPADPTKDNAMFAGWYYDSDFKKPVDWKNDTVSSTSSDTVQTVVLFAKWESTANTVSFYDRQGSIGSGTALSKQGVATGGYADLSTPITITAEGVKYPLTAGESVPGYGEFIGWYWLQGTERMPFSADMPINKSYDLFAMWKVGNFHITYESGEATGGITPVESGEYGLGTMYKVSGNTGALSVADKTFIGWKSSVDGKIYYAGTMMEVQGDTTLVAQFAEKNNSYTVTYKPGYKGGSQDIVTYVKKGNETKLPPDTTFMRPGYVFEGWEASDKTVYDANSVYRPTANETMTAKWTALYKVEFITDGGGTLKGQTSYGNIKDGTTWGEAQIVVPTPEAGVGYYFRGWEPVIPENGTKITKDTTYKAVFAPKTAVTFTAINGNKEYDGLPLTAVGVTQESLAMLKTGDTAKVTMKPDSTQTNAGTHANEIAEVRIYREINGVSTDVTDEYTIDPQPGTLRVDRKKVTVTPDSTGKVYGNADPVKFTATAGATINADVLDYTVSREPGEDVKADGYKITITPGDNLNYEIVPGEGVFTIAQREITISANPESKVIGTIADPPLTASYTDLGTGVVPAYTVSREPGEEVKTYPISVVAKAEENPNYKITVVGNTFTILPISTQITITPIGNGKVYGEDEPALAATVTGVPEGSPQPKYHLVREPGNTVGTYKISVVLEDDPNYTNISADATANFAITKKAATISIKEAGRVYGDATPEAFTAEVTGTIPGDSLVYDLQREKADNKNVGTYKIDAAFDKEQATNRNYEISVVKNDFKINPRPVTLKADDKTITYGDSEPIFTAQVTEGSIVGQDKLNYLFERDPGKDVVEGGYEIRVLPGSNPNYTLSTEPGTLTIGKKTITVTPEDTGVVYGDALDLSGINVEADGLVAGDTLNYEVVKSDAGNMNAGPYDLTVADKGNQNYTIETGTGILTIAPRQITITPQNNAKTFGAPEPNPLTTVVFGGKGLVNGDSIAYTLSRAAGEQVRSYDIYADVKKEQYPNYDITLKTGTFTIMPIQTKVTIIPDNKEAVYGEGEQVLSAKVTGAAEGTPVDYRLERVAGSDVGTYKIKVMLGQNPGYDAQAISVAEGTYEITPRPVTVAADDQTMVYGTPKDPELTARVLETGEDATSMGMVGDDRLTVNLNRSPGKDVDEYPIRLSVEQNENYSVTVKEGTFRITQKPIIVVADSLQKMYGDPEPTYTANAAVLEKGDELSVILSRTPGENAGQDYAIHAKVVEDATSRNYAIKTVDGKLTITPKPVMIAVNNVSKAVGTQDPTFSANAIGTIGTDSLNYTLTRAAGEEIGTYAINAVPGYNPNYAVSVTAGVLTITPEATTDPVVPPVVPGGTTTDDGTPTDPGAEENATAPPAAEEAPGPVQLVTIPASKTPLAGGDQNAEEPTVEIGENKIPLASNGVTASWALLNLILAFLTGIIMLVLLFTYFFGKDEDEEQDKNGEESRLSRTDDKNAKDKLKRKGVARLVSIVVTAVAVIVFIMTENITLPMVFIDGWTWLMAVIAAVQIIVAFFSRKSRKDKDDEKTADPQAQNA